jgi:hypothetical protein
MSGSYFLQLEDTNKLFIRNGWMYIGLEESSFTQVPDDRRLLILRESPLACRMPIHSQRFFYGIKMGIMDKWLSSYSKVVSLNALSSVPFSSEIIKMFLTAQHFSVKNMYPHVTTSLLKWFWIHLLLD